MAGLKFWKTKKTRLSDTVKYIKEKCSANLFGINRLEDWIDRAPYQDVISDALSLGYSLGSLERKQTTNSERRAIRACLLTRMVVEAPHKPSDARLWIPIYKVMGEATLQNRVQQYLTQLGNKPPGQLAADYAIACASDLHTPGGQSLAQMCWNAVVTCAYQSGAISDGAHTALAGISGLSYNNFVTLNDPVVGNAAAMATVPPGSYIGIFHLNTQQMDHSTNTLLVNQNVLTHAMIATGHGNAAGAKNYSCVGGLGPRSNDWAELNLQTGLRWIANTNTFNARELGHQGQSPREIHYRAI